MSPGLISGIIAGTVSLLSIASFFLARMKDAEERGAMKQQIKDLAAQVTELKASYCGVITKTSEQDACLATLAQKIEGVEKIVESISTKLDRLLDRQASGRPV